MKKPVYRVVKEDPLVGTPSVRMNSEAVVVGLSACVHVFLSRFIHSTYKRL